MKDQKILEYKLMHQFVEKFYSLIFEDQEKEHTVPYKHKLIVVSTSLILFLVVIGFIVRDIIKNLNQIN